MNSKHWTHERSERAARIKMIGGVGNPLFSVVWDRGHPDGPEIHTITDNAIVEIKNLHTNKLITMLIASPRQLRRYNQAIPDNVMQLAAAHVRAGLNH